MKFAHDETGMNIRRTLALGHEPEPDPAVVRFDMPRLQEVQVVIPEIHHVGLDQTAIDPEYILRKSGIVDPLDQIETDTVPFLVYAAAGGPVPERLTGEVAQRKVPDTERLIFLNIPRHSLVAYRPPDGDA